MTERKLKGLVSIHDVMPDTLDRCRALIQQLQDAGVSAIMLLVVPGRNWSDSDLQQLQNWQAQGLDLAGHGWSHEVTHCRSLYHKLHSLLLSRLAAEHLSLNGDEIAELIHACHRWFGERDLQAPELYVPPAWALGSLPRQALTQLPFSRIEVLGGVLDTQSGKLRRLPLSGYEADTAWRAANLRLWNGFNAWRARRSGEPLRIGIHPFDGELRLAEQMQTQIRACTSYCRYADL